MDALINGTLQTLTLICTCCLEFRLIIVIHLLGKPLSSIVVDLILIVRVAEMVRIFVGLIVLSLAGLGMTGWPQGGKGGYLGQGWQKGGWQKGVGKGHSKSFGPSWTSNDSFIPPGTSTHVY